MAMSACYKFILIYKFYIKQDKRHSAWRENSLVSEKRMVKVVKVLLSKSEISTPCYGILLPYTPVIVDYQLVRCNICEI